MWWNKRFNKYIDICVEKPLKTWKQVEKIFVKPKLYVHFFSNPVFNCPLANITHIAKILDIKAFDVGWKDKYNSPCHESSPYIWVCFFKRFGFSLNWHVCFYNSAMKSKDNGDIYYWEYLLDYLYYSKDINKVSNWTYASGYTIPTQQFSLTTYGKSLRKHPSNK